MIQHTRSTILLLLLSAAFTLHAQEDKLQTQEQQSSKYETVKMHVEGVCTMCKSRIELAAYDVKGVKSVEWDLESGTLTAVIHRKKATRQDIADALARKGHASELAEAVPEAYDALPDCCKYADGVPKHHDNERR